MDQRKAQGEGVTGRGTIEGTPDEGVAVKTLTATDRCDRCGAQAYLRVELPAGSVLLCGHHAEEHRSKLGELAALGKARFHDELTKASRKPILETVV